MLIATAGHVDHGKTALIGRLTGVDTDRLPDEKRRGLTIDLGFAYPAWDHGETLGFIDVPGHERFIRNMLVGVAGIDLAMLVVAADDGVMPQTLEHLAILELLGVPRLAVALTKIDRVDEARLHEAQQELRSTLAPTPFAHAAIFHLSSVTGAGVEALKAHLMSVTKAQPPAAEEGEFRLAVDRSFTKSGSGLVVTGTVFSGRVEVGQSVMLVPSRTVARVRGIHAQSREAPRGRVGERCALNLAGARLSPDEVSRGEWVVSGADAVITQRFDGRVRLLSSESRKLNNGTPVHVHHGAAAVTGRIALLQARQLNPGEETLAQITLDRPIHGVFGDRLVLRDPSAQRTLGGGLIVDPEGPRRGRAKPARLALLRALEQVDARVALADALAASPEGLDLGQYTRARNLTEDNARALLDDVSAAMAGQNSGQNSGQSSGQSSGRAGMERLGLSSEVTLGFATDHWRQVHLGIVETLTRHHLEYPGLVGPTPAELRRASSSSLPMKVFLAVMERMMRDGVIARSGARVRLPEHEAKLSAAERQMWGRVCAEFEQRGIKAPATGELARLLNLETRTLESCLRGALGRGQLVRVAPNRYFLTQDISTLASAAKDLAERSPEGVFDAKAYRDHAGVGRNLAIQILEYFDEVGLTRRREDVRVMVPNFIAKWQ